MNAVNITLTVILSGVALAAVIIRGVRYTMRAMLIEEGLIRPGKDVGHHWPNDWHSLPETLEGIYSELKQFHDGPG